MTILFAVIALFAVLSLALAAAFNTSTSRVVTMPGTTILES